MRINLPNVSFGRAGPASVAPAANGRLRFMSFGGGNVSSSLASKQASVGVSNDAGQQLLRALLAGAAAIDTDALQKALDLLEKDAKKFFATTQLNEDTVKEAIDHLTEVLSGKKPPEPADPYAIFVAQRIRVAPQMVASSIEYMEDGNDSDTAAKVAAAVGYAVPLLDRDEVKRILDISYNKSRIDLLSSPFLTPVTVADQVKKNTDNIRDLMRRHSETG